MKKRLIEFLSYLGIGQNKFEENVGLSIGFINKLGDNTTLKTLDKIALRYPQLNIDWLITGSGKMLKSDEKKDNSIQAIGKEIKINSDNNNNNGLIEDKERVIKELDAALKEKDIIIRDGSVALKEKDEQIKQLLSDISKEREQNRKLVNKLIINKINKQV